MAVSTSSASGLTSEDVKSLLIRPLEEQSVVLRSGPRIFESDGSPVKLPKLGGETQPSWTGENTQITEQDVDVNEITLLPSTMKSVKVLTRFSNELARQSVVALDSAIQQRLVTDVRNMIDTAFLSSTVTDGSQPEGLASQAGTVLPATASTVTLADTIDMWGEWLATGASESTARWFMHPRVFTTLQAETASGSGELRLRPDATANTAYQLLGIPVQVTEHVPYTVVGAGNDTTDIVLADMAQVAVARDQAPSVALLSETFADFDQQALRVTARFDIKTLNAPAIAVMNTQVADGS